MDSHFHLFAYGSLQEPASTAARALLEGCERIGEGEVQGTLYQAGSHPALLLSGEDRIEGAIWRCPAHRLQELDRYEGVEEGLYRRAAVRVGSLSCWVYVAGPRLGGALTPDARVRPARGG